MPGLDADARASGHLIWASLHGYATLRGCAPTWTSPSRRTSCARCSRSMRRARRTFGAFSAKLSRPRLVSLRRAAAMLPSCPPRARFDPAQRDKVDVRCALLAAEQWSVLGIADLRRCGLSANQVTRWVANGRLFPKYRGVYGVDPEPDGRGRVPRGGPGLRAGRRAVALLAPPCSTAGSTWDGRYPEVTATEPAHAQGHPRRTGRRHIERVMRAGHPGDAAGAHAHRPLGGTALRGRAPRRQRGAQPRADQGQRPRHQPPPRRGQAAQRSSPPPRPPATSTRTSSTRSCVRPGCRRPAVNVRRRRYIPDFRWPAQRVILEADSRRYHGHMLARADDAERQAILEAQGELGVADDVGGDRHAPGRGGRSRARRAARTST